jgi:hypothetical protein
MEAGSIHLLPSPDVKGAALPDGSGVLMLQRKIVPTNPIARSNAAVVGEILGFTIFMLWVIVVWIGFWAL